MKVLIIYYTMSNIVADTYKEITSRRCICREHIASVRYSQCSSETSTKRRVKKRRRERAGQLVDIYSLSRVFLFFFVSPRDAALRERIRLCSLIAMSLGVEFTIASSYLSLSLSLSLSLFPFFKLSR